MPVSRQISVVLLLFIVSFTSVAAAMTVYMKDKSRIEAQSAWIEGNNVNIRINSDFCVIYPVSKVDVRRSGITAEPQETPQIVDNVTTASAPARPGDIMDELVEVSGCRRDMDSLFGRGGHGEVSQIFADTYSPAVAEKIFRRCLERRLDKRELAAVVNWYKSPVGVKIVEADSVWDFNRLEKSLSYIRYDSAPGYKERVNLITQIEKSTGSSEMAARLTQNLMRKMAKAIPPDYPNGDEIKKQIQEAIPTLESMRKLGIQITAYNYRDLSTRELRDYLGFLRSAAGKKYIAAERVAYEEIFRKVTINIEKEFRKYVRS